MKFRFSFPICWSVLLTVFLVDAATSLTSSDLDELKNRIRDADLIVVNADPSTHSEELYRSRHAQDIDAFADSLVLECPDQRFFCMCAGSQTILLFREGKPLLKITNHHNASIRSDLIGSNIKIAEKETWFRWFDERGIMEPRKEYIKDLENQNKLLGGEQKPQTIESYLEDRKQKKRNDLLFSVFGVVKFVILLMIIVKLIMLSKAKLRLAMVVSLSLFVILGIIHSILVHFSLEELDMGVKAAGEFLRILILLCALGILFSVGTRRETIETDKLRG